MGLAILGFLLLFTIGAGVSVYVRHVYRGAKAAGAFSVLPKTDPARRVRSVALRAPATARVVLAQAWADDWVARRAHKRQQPAAPRRSLLQRLVFPGRPAPQVPAPPEAPAAPPPDNVRPLGARKTAGGDVPQKPAPQPVPRPRPQPVPTPPTGRTPPMAANGPGAASDMFAAVSTITGHARSGGIRAKATAMMTCTEGFAQQAGALEQLARDMQDAEYPPMVWEPLVQAAAHMRASGVMCSESNGALTTILTMPARDLAASSIHVPVNAEFNKD